MCVLVPLSSAYSQAVIADHTAADQFVHIPASVVAEITADYRIYYGHTSHGSQIMTGLTYVENENSLFDPPYFFEYSDDLGHSGDTSWVPHLRQYLTDHVDINMAMMSWCGGASDNTEDGINIYLNKMNELEGDFPGVTFIYMTGHLDGGGLEGNLYRSNNQIRDYCIANNKILFDFADVESYDPDGTYYPDDSDDCGWCYDWCAVHTCTGCPGYCAHSHCFNCYRKGRAWWWMMAKIDGWEAEPCCVDIRGNANADGSEDINISDITYLVDYLFGIPLGPAPPCQEEGNANGDGEGNINISDITYLVDYLFGIPLGPAPPPCP